MVFMDNNIKYYLEDLQVGMKSSTTSVITANMIDVFAEITGDNNPIHVNAEFAASTQFGQRIAHGALSASFISERQLLGGVFGHLDHRHGH